MIEIDVYKMIENEVCAHCASRMKELSCNMECPYQNYFDEIRANCASINKDANYLLELAADGENRADEERNDNSSGAYFYEEVWEQTNFYN